MVNLGRQNIPKSVSWMRSILLHLFYLKKNLYKKLNVSREVSERIICKDIHS